MMTTTMMMPDSFIQLGSVLATVMFIWAIYNQYVPDQVRSFIESNALKYSGKALNYFSPYLVITFDEYSGENFDRSEAYTAIQTYVSETSATQAKKMKANSLQGNSLMLSIAEYEEVCDDYRGVQVWWTYNMGLPKNLAFSFSLYPGKDEKRYYQLTFHRRHRELITTSYLNYVLEEGKAIAVRKRQRKLYTNTSDPGGFGSRSAMWSHIAFKHPGQFRTLAMEPRRKQEIIDDLLRFSRAKDYYEKVGKPWKRGYLLHGPPGTGKSTMVAAIANFLGYDIYDLELAAVKDNVELRKLLIETSSKSIILIEDIDCSVDLTGQREKKKAEEEGEKEEDPVKKASTGEKKKGSEVTLSGLLNFIDGIWSACGEERIIIFTTNYLDKLDSALIRRGRMDKHIGLSYCCFEAFKVLAKNYLDLDSHELFAVVERLLGAVKMTPADVAENLMPKSSEVDVDACLESLIRALEKARKEAELKAAEEKMEEKDK